MKNFECPEGGDVTNDCEDCVYTAEYHFVDGECVLRTPASEGRFGIAKEDRRV